MIRLGDSMLVNSKDMLEKARLGGYAIPHFNINNLEWAKYILEECETLKVPVILGVSEGAKRYMGGYHVISYFVQGLIKDLNLSIPVCLHLDHGSSVESCKEAIDSGFSSVMIDASKYSLEENIRMTQEVVRYAHPRGVTVEAELGRVGGEEDGVADAVYYARLEDCISFSKQTGIDSLAPALGSVHGFYKGEPHLQFATMKAIRENLSLPLVLHGGTGIPADQIKKAISCGITKINVNTDLQSVWSNAVREYLDNDKLVYDPRKIIGSGERALKERVREMVSLFGTR